MGDIKEEEKKPEEKRQKTSSDRDVFFSVSQSEKEEESRRDEMMRNETAIKAQEKGNELAEKGDFQAALTVWANGLSAHPSAVIAAKLHESRAQVLILMNRCGEAASEADKACHILPRWPAAYCTRSRAFLNGGWSIYARDGFKQVLELIEKWDEVKEGLSSGVDIEEVREDAMFAEKVAAEEEQRIKDNIEPIVPNDSEKDDFLVRCPCGGSGHKQ